MQHLKPRSTTVVLYQGDDMDRLAELHRRVAVAERIAKAGETARAGDDDQSVTAAKAEFDAFVDQAAERALMVELRSIGKRRFRDLVAEHPPRMVTRKIQLERALGEPESPTAESSEEAEHPDDEGWGVNTETFAVALLCYRDGETLTIAQPEFATKADVERFVNDELADGDFDQLWQTGFLLNRSPSRNPKDVRYTLDSLSMDET